MRLLLRLAYTDETITYKLYSHVLKPCIMTRDLASSEQSNLTLGLKCTEIARKANARSKLIRKSSLSDSTNLTRAFIVYVRPILEYCSPV